MWDPFGFVHLPVLGSIKEPTLKGWKRLRCARNFRDGNRQDPFQHSRMKEEDRREEVQSHPASRNDFQVNIQKNGFALLK